VFAGPSGAGKSTLIKRLSAEFPSAFGFSVSHTTRKPRPGEVDGREYHFVDRTTMEKEIAEGLFIENAVYSGNMYGTSIKAVADVVTTGKICLLDIDMQGVLSVKKTELNPYYIFICPPSMEELEKRLRGRGDTDEDAMAKRLATARIEMEYKDKPDFWDLVLVNDKIDETYAHLKAFMQARYPSLA